MVKVAIDHFGFNPDAQLKSEICDVYEYIQTTKPETFDLIFMDVNYEELNTKISPP